MNSWLDRPRGLSEDGVIEPLSLAALAAETRLARGPLPATIAAVLVERGGFIAAADEFLLEVTEGLRFHYRRGQGVRYAAAAHYDAAAIETFHQGSVWGAIAWMNGLIPLHASAVARDGQVHAFAGVSGAGKSTLVAALAARGWPLFADDIVTLCASTGGALPLAAPGHKRLKLWDDAIALTGGTRGERVWPGLDKFYVDVGRLDHRAPLPLASLTLIEDGDDDAPPAAIPVRGAARLEAFSTHGYRRDLRLPAMTAPVFVQLVAMAAEVPVFRLRRPRNATRFAESADAAARHLTMLAAA